MGGVRGGVRGGMRGGVRDKGEERRGRGVLGGGKNDLLLHHIPPKPNIQTDARWRKKNHLDFSVQSNVFDVLVLSFDSRTI